MSNLILYHNYPVQLKTYDLCELDIEFHLINAYFLTFYHGYTITGEPYIPTFFDIYDHFIDNVERCGQVTFEIEALGCQMLKASEMSLELIEYILKNELKVEFVTIEGDHVNSAQNMILEELV